MYRIAARPAGLRRVAAAVPVDQFPGCVIWRFYMAKDRLWRWQRVTVGGSVVDESRAAYGDFDSCVASARSNGYLFEKSQPKAISSAH